MEEGYRLGKDKGYKEYKVQVEEEEAKKAKNQARKDITGYHISKLGVGYRPLCSGL
jgi:hypothetical protein